VTTAEKRGARRPVRLGRRSHDTVLARGPLEHGGRHGASDRRRASRRASLALPALFAAALPAAAGVLDAAADGDDLLFTRDTDPDDVLRGTAREALVPWMSGVASQQDACDAVAGVDREALRGSRLVQAATERGLTIIGEAARHVSPGFQETTRRSTSMSGEAAGAAASTPVDRDASGGPVGLVRSARWSGNAGQRSGERAIDSVDARDGQHRADQDQQWFGGKPLRRDRAARRRGDAADQ